MGVLAQMMKIPAFFSMNRSATGSTAPTCTLFLKRNRDTSSWAVAQMGCRVVYLSVLLAHTVEKIDKVTDKQTKTKEEKKNVAAVVYRSPITAIPLCFTILLALL